MQIHCLTKAEVLHQLMNLLLYHFSRVVHRNLFLSEHVKRVAVIVQVILSLTWRFPQVPISASTSSELQGTFGCAMQFTV